MSFLQPLFLAGLLAASLPLIIHLINRRKAVRRPFPALKLLKESNERIARSVKVRQWLLLALRVLAIAVLALALAKPYFLSSQGITAEERMPTAVVFVVENGFAMSHDNWWDLSERETRRQLSNLRPWDEAAVVTTSDTTPPLARLTSDHSEVRRSLSNIQWRYEPGDLADALTSASDILAGSQLPNRRIVVIGSGTDSPTIDRRRELNLSHPVDYVSIRGGDEEAVTDNLAIVAVDYQQDGPARQGQWRVDAVVENLGRTDRSDVRIQLRIDDQVVAGTTIDVPAGQTASHSFLHRLDGSEMVPGLVELVDADELEADNQWHFLIRPRHRIRALLINGSPSTSPHNDELFFLTRALSPDNRDDGNVTTSVTTIEGLNRRELEDFDVVVMANVDRVSTEQASQIHRFVEDGGGLFITMGDQVQPESYNSQLADLLPRPLRGMKQLAERNDPDAPVKITRMGHPQRQHPIFQVFGLPGGSSIQSVQVYSYMLLDPAPSDRESRLILSYQDNAPALLERQVGQGRVLLFTSSIDRDWTNFPMRSAYLPMVNRSLLYLARRATSQADDLHKVGDPVRLDVGDLVRRRAIIHDPDGRRRILEPVDGGVTFTPEQPGVYRFFADEDEGSTARTVDSLTIAANVDRSGSALTAFPHTILDTWQYGEDGEPTVGRGSQDERRVNLWSYFLFIVTLALLAETVLGSRRSVLVRTMDQLKFWNRSDADA